MKRLKKFLLTTVVILGAAILISVIHHYQLKAAVNRYITELKANGEPMDLAQVLPPPVPPEENSADTLREADSLFSESFAADKSLLETNYVSGMKMVAPGKAMIRWQQPDIRDIDGTNSWKDLTAAVAQNAKAFALLQQIIEKPNFGFQIEYGRGVADLNFTNFYLLQSKRESQRLEAAVICDLHQGDTESAVKDLRTMLALVKVMRDERLVISELVRMAMTSIALNANWEILQSTNLTDEQLAELQRDWMSLDFVRGDENALAMERATGEISLGKWRGSHSELQHYFGIGIMAREAMGLPDDGDAILERIKMSVKIFEWRFWWSYPDELRYLKGLETLLEAPRFVGTNYSFQTALHEQGIKLQMLGIDKLDDEFVGLLDPDRMDMHSMLSQSVQSLSGVFDKVMRTETAKQIMITAIALKRYQLKHGNHPPDLNSLVPEFLSIVPLDPVDGQPLRYRSNTDGTFTLYSVGENGVDDGGDPSLENGVTSSGYYWLNNHALDWAWPQPATPAEIDYFREHPPK